MKKDRRFTKSRKARITESTSPFVRLIVCSGKAISVALTAALISILSGCAIGYSMKNPSICVGPTAITALYISFFVCGFISARSERGNPIITGLFSGAMYLVLILIISLMLSPTDRYKIGGNLLISMITLPCSLFGAFLGNIRVSGRRTSVRTKRRR